MELLEKYKWPMVWLATEDHGALPYREAVESLIDSKVLSTVTEGQLIWKYIKAMSKLDKGITPSAKGIEVALHSEYSGDGDESVLEFLLERNSEHSRFSKAIKQGKHKDIVVLLRQKLIDIAIEAKVEHYARGMANSGVGKRIELAGKIMEASRLSFPKDIVSCWGKPTPKKDGRILRPSNIPWIDPYIRKGRGFSTGEMTLFVIGTNRGKDLLSSQLAYRSAESGCNVLYVFNEDHMDDTKNRMRAKVLNMDPLDIATELTEKELEESDTKLSDSLAGRLVSVKLTSEQMGMENVISTIRRFIRQYDLHNPRIIFNYLSLVTLDKGLVSEQWRGDMDFFNALETIANEFNGDIFAFEQVKAAMKDNSKIELGMLVGDNKKENKARHAIGIGADKDMLDRGHRFMNIMKVSGGKYGSEDLILKPSTFEFVRRKKVIG